MRISHYFTNRLDNNLHQKSLYTWLDCAVDLFCGSTYGTEAVMTPWLNTWNPGKATLLLLSACANKAGIAQLMSFLDAVASFLYFLNSTFAVE